jgi:DNA-binding beta-propeller fold protein YncE
VKVILFSYPRKRGSALVTLAVTTGLLCACAGFEEPALQPVIHETLTRVIIPPANHKSASFDYMTMDQANHRLYIADDVAVGVDVMDVSGPTARYITTIPVPAAAPPNGIDYAPQLGTVFVGLSDGTVGFIDANPASPHVNTVVRYASTHVEGVADLLVYDSADRRIFATNPDDGIISALDPVTGKLLGQIQNLGATEQPQYNPVDQMLYVGDSDNNSILKIDPRRLAVVHQYLLPDVCVPHGLAIDPATDQGLIGCGDKDSLITMAWDFRSERVIGTYDFAGGGDQVIFDPVAQHFYFAAQGYAPPEMAIFNADPITFLTSVPTSHHSLQVAYDETHRTLYTIDGLHLQAALWQFPDPVAGCSGHEALLASEGAPRSETPNCHPAAQGESKL